MFRKFGFAVIAAVMACTSMASANAATASKFTLGTAYKNNYRDCRALVQIQNGRKVLYYPCTNTYGPYLN